MRTLQQPLTKEFLDAFTRFLDASQACVNEYFATHYKNLTPPKLEDDPKGQKYIRVWQVDGGSRSAWCFVEVATGDVLKPDSWKRPAKGKRGSIYAETFEGYGVSVYGAKYMNQLPGSV